MTKEEADRYLKKIIIERYGKAIQNAVKVPITQNQYDALLSLVYNTGASNLEERSIFQVLNTGDYLGAYEAFMIYTKSKGVQMQGLINRRNAERNLYIRKSAEILNR